MVLLPPGGIWCKSCRSARQEELASEGQLLGASPVGIILEDFETPQPICQCGGIVGATDHESSLLHRKWAWAQKPEVIAAAEADRHNRLEAQRADDIRRQGWTRYARGRGGPCTRRADQS